MTAQCFTYGRRGIGVDKFSCPERIEETIGCGLAVLTVAGLSVKRHLPQDGRDANARIADGATDGVISGGRDVAKSCVTDGVGQLISTATDVGTDTVTRRVVGAFDVVVQHISICVL